MRISLNWLAEYIDVSKVRLNLKDTIEKLAMRGLEIEGVEDLSRGFENVVVGLVEKREKHPNADRLSVCTVQTGRETLQIVCGAPNVKEGLKVAVSLVGAELPNGMKIIKSKIRDVESFGMICSESELGLSEESKGIIELPKDAPVGTPFATYLNRNDVTFDVNVTPNRGDVLSHIGFARELGSIIKENIKLPSSSLGKANTFSLSSKAASQLNLHVEATDLCLQYHAQYIEGVSIAPSPEWLQQKLKAVGLRPISNVVDITNFVLHEFGIPLHAFDYSKLAGGSIIVRRARQNEPIELLDKTKHKLTSDDLVIADQEKPVALAGVMGGFESEVTETTTTVLLEAAQFLPASIRKTSRRIQKQTDASYRFERKVDPGAVLVALERATSLIVEIAGGKALAKPVSAHIAPSSQRAKAGQNMVSVSLSRLNQVLGLSLEFDQVKACLNEIGFEIDSKSNLGADFLQVRIPSFRPDIEIAEDVYEEVLRVWGYEKVEPKAPKLEFLPLSNPQEELKQKKLKQLKSYLVAQGFSESMNYAFTSNAKNDFWGGPDQKLAVTLQNPLNEEFTTLKTSLLSSLFDNLLNAFYHQEQNIRLFEIRPVYFKDDKSETGVNEQWRVAGIFTGRSYQTGLEAQDQSVDFFSVKGVVQTMLDVLGTRGARFMGPDSSENVANTLNADKRVHPAQSAIVAIGKGPAGFVGRLHPKIQSEHKLKKSVYLFEFSLDRALELSKTDVKFSPISKFPKVHRELSLVTPVDLSSEKVLQTIQKLGKPLLESVRVVDLYRGKPLPEQKQSLSVSMTLSDPNRTLEEKEIELFTTKVLSGLESQLGVSLRPS